MTGRIVEFGFDQASSNIKHSSTATAERAIALSCLAYHYLLEADYALFVRRHAPRSDLEPNLHLWDIRTPLPQPPHCNLSFFAFSPTPIQPQPHTRTLVLQSVGRCREDLAERFPSQPPSQRAVPSEFAKYQTGDVPYAYCNRPYMTSDIPVTLLHPVFGRFADNCRTYVPTSEENKLIRNLSLSLNKFVTKEVERQNDFLEEFNNYTGITLQASKVPRTEYATDGHAVIGRYPYIVTEAKAELCSGGNAEPSFQGLAYYSELSKRNFPSAPSNDTVLPCLLIFYLGATIGFAGLAYTTRPVMDILALTTLTVNPHDEHAQQQAARIFGAARIAARDLEQYYRSLVSSTPSFRFAGIQSPYPTTFTSRRGPQAGAQLSFLCDQRLLPDNGSLVFVGKLSSTHPPGGEIVVKFTRRYGPEVHDFCNDHNCAPALLGFEKLDGGWFLVVMERLRGYEMLGPATENVVAVQQVLKEIVGQFHEHNMVHGDLRAPNIMLHPNTKDVKLIDFDWAGVQGNVRYPPNLSEDITWPEGVSDGELILPAHDDYFIDSLV